jgi:hypothetical protein
LLYRRFRNARDTPLSGPERLEDQKLAQDVAATARAAGVGSVRTIQA